MEQLTKRYTVRDRTMFTRSATGFALREQLDECYTVRGNGGWEACLVVQDKLQNYGLCSFTRPDPDPPNWRFFFETNLKPERTIKILAQYVDRYQIAIKDC